MWLQQQQQQQHDAVRRVELEALSASFLSVHDSISHCVNRVCGGCCVFPENAALSILYGRPMD